MLQRSSVRDGTHGQSQENFVLRHVIKSCSKVPTSYRLTSRTYLGGVTIKQPVATGGLSAGPG